jgi:mannose-6-phosphate isomerase
MKALVAPLKIRSDHFTPLTRTPWAGFEISRSFKQHVAARPDRIGESWEFSCDPDFPSRLDDGRLLMDVIAEAPSEMLGPTQSQTCEILVKLIEASEPLSVQLHPSDDDPNLKPQECGKPESWLVLSAQPGSGIYLGFAKPLSKSELTTHQWTKESLQFVPVNVGDYFEIEPGVPHAIGPGVCLLEPQRILFGKSGKTFRLWDWDRRYNSQGEVDMINGTARELHLQQAAHLLDPERQFGIAFANQCRRSSTIQKFSATCSAEFYPPNPYYQTIVLNILGHASVDIRGGYGAMIGLGGEISVKNELASIQVCKGSSAFLAAASFPLSLSSSGASNGVSRAAFIIPAQAQLIFN